MGTGVGTFANLMRAKPRLLFFSSATSGRCRLVDGYLASVLQRGRNHKTFEVTRIDIGKDPDLAERFRVNAVPTFLVVHHRQVTGRLDDVRSAVQIRTFLKPWLNGS